MATSKRKKLTIAEKVKIIQEVEKNRSTPAIETARKFNLAPSSLFCIMKNKQLILDEEVKCWGEDIKRKTKEVEEEEEEAVQEEESVPTLGETVQALEVVRRYLTSFDFDSTTISEVNSLEREVLNVQSTRQKKQASLQDYFNK
jgi:vacuolar-type H+-ATPase subunit I/STV1